MKRFPGIGLCVCLTAVALSVGCRQLSDNILTVDIESNAERFKQAKLSYYCSEIQYIQLETRPAALFGSLPILCFSDSLVFVSDRQGALFGHNGEYIAGIGSFGRGPGEYTSITNPVINSRGEIAFQDMYDLLMFKPDGKHLKTIKNFFLIDSVGFVGSWIPVGDSLIFGKIASITGKESEKAVIITNKGVIVKRFPNYNQLDAPKLTMGPNDRISHLRYFRDMLYFKEAFNDTLFLLNNELNLVPVYEIRLGRYSMPESERAAIPPDEVKYFSVRDIFQTERFVYIICYMGEYFPARRLTPRVVFNDVISWYNSMDALGILDRQTGDFFFCEPASTDNRLATTGLINDIDGGPRFIPYAQVNDSTLAMLVLSKHLREHVASEEFLNSSPLFPDKHKALEELANRLSDDDNPVLMVVRMK